MNGYRSDTHTMEYYSTMRKHILSLMTACVDLECIVLNEKSQQNKHYVMSLI